MFIKNNSKTEWPHYNIGGANYVDVPSNATFEVPDFIGEALLKVLGHPNWLVKVDKPAKEEKVEKAKTAVDKEELRKMEDEKKKEEERKNGKKKIFKKDLIKE